MKKLHKHFFPVFLLSVLAFQFLLTTPVFAAAPLPPANVSASDGMYADKIEISWTGASGATYYDIYRAELPAYLGGIPSKIGSSADTSYEDFSATCDKIYYYWVKSKNSDGASKYSLFNSGYCAGTAAFSLALALDNTQLAFETGGDADWFWQNSRHYEMQSAAESGDIDDSQESWIQTTVNGPGSLAFYWKVSSQINNDFLEFYVDDIKKDAISGTVNWTQKNLQVLAGSHTLKWRFVKNDSFSGGLDCGWLDYVVWTSDAAPLQSDPPAMPTGVSASDGTYSDKIRITWSLSRDATSYEVYRAASFDGQKTKIGTTTKTFYDDTTIPCGTDYYYWIKAVNAAGASDLFYSDLGEMACAQIPDVPDDPGELPDSPVIPDIEEPLSLDPPSGVSATDGIYTNKVRITWTPVTGATSYEIYRHLDCCGARTLIGTTSGTYFDDVERTLTAINYYWVKAKNSKTISFYSDYNTGHWLQKPLRPIKVAASDGTYVERIHITWSPDYRPPTDLSCGDTCGGDALVEKIDSYDVYRAEYLDGPKTKIGTTSKTWFDDFDIPCDTCGLIEYYYWIVAKNAAGSSHYSDYDRGYPYKTLRDPRDIRATDGKTSIPFCVEITWSHVPGAVAYNIFRSDSLTGAKIKIGSIKYPECCPCFTDAPPVCQKIYYYWVQSVDAKGIGSCILKNYDTGYCAGD